jgi:hypothetical protein
VKKRWQEAYRKKKADDELWQSCVVCGLRSIKGGLDCHHVAGRHSLEDVLDYVYVCRGCHNKIHEHPEWAE